MWAGSGWTWTGSTYAVFGCRPNRPDFSSIIWTKLLLGRVYAYSFTGIILSFIISYNSLIAKVQDYIRKLQTSNVLM